MTQTVISGEWLLTEPVDPNAMTYTEGYVGEVVDRWSGGVVFLATREVVEAIVAAQDRMNTQVPESEVLTWDGDVLVNTYPEDDDVRRVEPDADGRYLIGWWTWYEVEAAEVTGMIRGAHRERGDIVCGCGNTPGADGFSTCLPDGTEVEPLADGPWAGHYRCRDCGTVHHYDTLPEVSA